MEEMKTDTKEDSLKDNAKDLLTHATDFLDTFYQLTVVNVTQKGVNIASGIINGVLIFFLALSFLLFAGLGLAWWLGNLVNSRIGGFFIVAGIFLLVMFIIIAMRKARVFPFLRNMITKKIYE